MIRSLEALAAQAIVGIERQPPVWPVVPGPVGDLLRQLGENQPDPAPTLLRMAGVLAVCAAAGYRPPAAGYRPPAADAARPEPCPPETLRLADDPPLAAALSRILADGPERLRIEALRRLAGVGAGLPHGLLPPALELGRQSRALRPFLMPVLGQRGVWLAGQNPEWRFAASAVVGEALDSAAWETGSAEQRAVYLRHCRAADPARGRELYIQALPELGAKERAALLAEFATGLGGADEEVVEAALRDRAKEVRQAAAGLLLRLPDSRYAQRMVARLAPCLRQQRKLLKTTWLIEPPEAFGGDWKADALEEAKPKYEQLGERAWWLYQLAKSTPLSWWENHTGWTPAALLDWATKGEWTDALWRGWLDVLEATGDATWAAAFLERKPGRGVHSDTAALVRHLPRPERERHWLDWLAHADTARLGATLAQICATATEDGAAPVSAGFARQTLDRVWAALARKESAWDYALRGTLPEFACLIPPEIIPEIRQAWTGATLDAPSANESIPRLLDILELRAILHHHPLLASNPP